MFAAFVFCGRGGRICGEHVRHLHVVGHDTEAEFVEGIGVGGFFVIMGLAFFINSLFDHRGDEYHALPPRPGPGPGPITPEPPRHD